MHRGRLACFVRALDAATDIDQVIRTTRREVREVAGFTAAWLHVLDNTRTNVRLVAIACDAMMLRTDYPVQVPVDSVQLVQEVVASDGPVIVGDARTDPRGRHEIPRRQGNRTAINFPIPWLNAPMGALGIGTFHREGTREPSRETLAHIAAVANQVAFAVARIQWNARRALRETAPVEADAKPATAPHPSHLGSGPDLVAPGAAPSAVALDVDAPAAARPAPSAPFATLDGTSELVIIDGPGNAVWRGATAISLGRRRDVRALLLTLAGAATAVPRETLVTLALGERYAPAIHDSRLRVNMGRLRALVRPVGLGVVAESGGYRLVKPSDTLVIRDR